MFLGLAYPYPCLQSQLHCDAQVRIRACSPEWYNLISHSHSLFSLLLFSGPCQKSDGASSLMLTHLGLACLETLTAELLTLLCSPGTEQGLLFQVLKLVIRRNSSSALVTSGHITILAQVTMDKGMRKASFPCYTTT